MNCVVCETTQLQRLAHSVDSRVYFQCQHCEAIFLDPSLRLSAADEKKRYLEHNNNIEDPAYQKFVMPIVEIVKERFEAPSRGLDFGSGTGPVLSFLLKKSGYEMSEYDVFFNPDADIFSQKFDFIVSCEVAEHLFKPRQEFERLASMIRPGGLLILQTQMWQGEDIFEWYYSRDPSHIVFFNPTSFRWLQTHLGMTKLELRSSRLIVLEKGNAVSKS